MAFEFAKIFEAGSFFNLWYWLFLAFMWSRATYFTLGVPYHDARMGYDRQGQYMRDFEELIRINVDHNTEMFDQYGAAFLGIVCFFLASCAVLGFGHGHETMQAVFLLVGPLTLVALFSIWFAYRLRSLGLKGDSLYKAYAGHRRMKQIFGLVAMVLVSIWTGIHMAEQLSS